MKLDLLLAQQGVPTVAPYPTADEGRFARPGQAIAQAGQQLESLAVQGLTVIRQAEEARKELAIRTDVARMKSRFQLDAHELDANLRTTVQDPDEYYQQLQDGLQERYQQIADTGTKYPEVMARLRPQLEQLIASQRMSGLTHRIALTKSSTNASIDETVANLTQLARQVPLGDQETWAGLGNEIQSAIGRGEPVNGANVTGDAQRKALVSLFSDRAHAHAREAPEDFTQEGAKLYGSIIGRGLVDQIGDAANARVLAARKQQNAEWKDYYDRIDKEAEDERLIQVGELESQAAAETLTRVQLEDARRMRMVNNAEYWKISTYLNRPDKVAKDAKEASDLAILTPLSLDVHSTNPSTTGEQINGLVGNGLILADAVRLKDTLRSTKNALQAKANTLIGQRQSQAEQEMMLTAGVVAGTMMEKLDPIKQKALSAFMPELRARSSFFRDPATGKGGQEDPLAVWEDIKPRMERMLGGEANLSAQQTAEKLKFNTPEALEAARSTIRPDGTKMSDADYKAQRSYFLEWQRAEKAAADTKARMDAAREKAKGAKGGAGSYRGGGGTMGR